MKDITNINELFHTDECDFDTLLQQGKIGQVFGASHTMYTFQQRDTKYYFKEMPIRELIHELVALKIGNLVDIPMVELEVAILNQTYGTLSKNFQQPGDKKVALPNVLGEYFESSIDDEDSLLDFLTLKKLNNLEDIWFALEEKYQDTAMVAATMNSIVDIFCFDMLTGQSDRHLGNIELLENNGRIRVAPCYDNSSIYGGNRSLLGIDFDDFGTSSEAEKLAKFLTISSQEFVDRFFTMHQKLEQVGIDAILNSVADDYSIPIYPEIRNDLVHGYQQQMQVIGQCKDKLDFSNKRK